jgi:hypothetical protein
LALSPPAPTLTIEEIGLCPDDQPPAQGDAEAASPATSNALKTGVTSQQFRDLIRVIIALPDTERLVRGLGLAARR